MCEHDSESVQSHSEAKDSYDEFEERVRRIGLFIFARLKELRNEWSALKFNERIGHIIALATLLSLVVYAAYTIKIYKANERAADAAANAVTLAEDSEHLDQRAWVTITAMNSPHPPQINKEFTYAVHFIDTGKTPASNVVIHHGDELTGKEEHPNLSNNPIQIRLGILSPGSERTHEGSVTPRFGTVLTANDLKFLQNHTLTLHGKITYDDIFGCHHWITYCATLREDWKGYDFCSEYNDTDTQQPCHGK